MRKKLLLLALFAIAMGYLEAVVVVYLRALYYPQGFAFPIEMIGLHHASVELGREAATIIMLLAVAFLAERTRRGRFACFMLLFGIWDITYYVFLWVTISWPASILDWDLLFLLPVIWTGPVIAPILVSVLLILTAIIYYARRDAAETIPISRIEWAIAILGAAVIFASFAFNHGVAYRGGTPTRFAWEIYAAGMAMLILILAGVCRKLTSME